MRRSLSFHPGSLPGWVWLLLCQLGALPSAVHAQAETLVEFRYTPVARAQVAIWIEDASGVFRDTVVLTEAVGYRGIGNRPGASQMNSGYRWPWGRREGALPVWAHRRAQAPGARLFPRVIFQSRVEGFAVRTSFDNSPDDYYCLQFEEYKSRRDGLDAMSCATVFTSDKGRYLTEADVQASYAEPWEIPARADTPASGLMQPLPLLSHYPPRRDVMRCTDEGCYDHLDVDRYAEDALAVMPEIDAVTRATAVGGEPQRVLLTLPDADYPPGDYVALIEVNVEGDYNDAWNDQTFPRPALPMEAWDFYTELYGYPYRGQPSVVFAVPFQIPAMPGSAEYGTAAPTGRSSWEHFAPDYGELQPVETSGPLAIAEAAGSGIDRLQRDAGGQRFVVDVMRMGQPAPDAAAVAPVEALSVTPHPDPYQAHAWAELRFQVPTSELPLHRYEVRVATRPMNDEDSFLRFGRPARGVASAAEGTAQLNLPVDGAPGDLVQADIGDLSPETHYYIAVRAVDERNRPGPLRSAEVTTTARRFVTVSPCFIATAAYGSALAPEVGQLRRLRDRYLMPHAPGRLLVRSYYALSPALVPWVARDGWLRTTVTSVLGGLLELARTFG